MLASRSSALGSSSRLIIVTSSRKTLELIDSATGENLDEMLLEFSSDRNAVVFSPNGQLIAVRSGSICLVLNVDDNQISLLGALPTIVSGTNRETVVGARFLDDRRIAVALRKPYTPPSGIKYPEMREQRKKYKVSGRIAVYELPL